MKSHKISKKMHKDDFRDLRLVQEILTYHAPDIRSRMHFYKLKGHGRVEKYIYQLETFFRGKWRFVVRYNNFHGVIHKDKFNPSGNRISREYFEGISVHGAMKLADKDIKKNYKVCFGEFIEHGE